MRPTKSRSWFTRFAKWTARAIRANSYKIAEEARAELRRGREDTGIPEVDKLKQR